MSEFLRSAWVPTLLFTLPIFIAELLQGSVNPPVGTFACLALAVVPSTWQLIVVKPRRGGFGRNIQAGVLSGLLIVLVSVLWIALAGILGAGLGQGPGGLTDALIIFVVPLWLAIMTVMGLLVGTLSALWERFTAGSLRR
jgi:hypothetical protein